MVGNVRDRRDEESLSRFVESNSFRCATSNKFPSPKLSDKFAISSQISATSQFYPWT
jgi:hypothetical protein